MSFDVTTILGVPPLSQKVVTKWNIIVNWKPKIMNVSIEKTNNLCNALVFEVEPNILLM
jgi:hypothetical protein